MTSKEMEKRFSTANPLFPEAYVVSEIMLDKVKSDKSTTMSELNQNLSEVIAGLKTMNNGVIRSAVAELFLRYVSLNSTLHKEINKCRKEMTDRGQEFVERIHSSRQRIADLCHPFVLDGSTIMTHSHSRVALNVLKKAAESKKHFTVYVTESQPDCSGYKTKEVLDKEGIPCTVILDAEIGYYMESVDMVLVGAESVVESGGIINKVGSYPIAICARQLNKPFYVLAESFKFARLYPLNQEDLRNQFKDFDATLIDVDETKENTKTPRRLLKDYTPPAFISLLFTDLGILTPSAVSDELIKIYT